MKLLLASTSFPLKPGDNLSPFIYDFCKQLENRGWNITVVVPHHKGAALEETWGTIRIKRFKYLPEPLEDLGYTGGIMPGIKKAPWKMLKLPFYIYSMYREVLNAAGSSSYDLINFHWLFPASFWLNLLQKKCGIPIVLTGHGTDVRLACKSPFDKFAAKAFSVSSALTLNSDYMLSLLGQRNLPGRIGIIPMGVDTDIFTPGDKKPSDSNEILYIGRLITQKGIDILINAFIKAQLEIPETRLKIIGYGPEETSIRDIIDVNNIGDKIEFIKSVPHSKLVEQYRGARVLVLPSVIPEGFGMTPVEAGACGVPTLTFGLGGTSEIVKDGQTGIISEMGVDNLSAHLVRVMKDDDLADQMGAAARNRILENFSWAVIGDKFDMLFKEIVDTKRN